MNRANYSDMTPFARGAVLVGGMILTLMTGGNQAPLYAAHDGDYQAQLIDVHPEYGRGVAIPGGYAYAIVRMRNIGAASWGIGGPIVRVRTAIPLDRHSKAYSFDWDSDTRASRVDVNGSDRQKGWIDPGDIAIFIFTLHVPLEGLFCEDFELVADLEDGPDRMGNHFRVEPNDCWA